MIRKLNVAYGAAGLDGDAKLYPANMPDVTTTAKGAMLAADKVKLNAVAAGAQVNVIESITVGGTPVTITDKVAILPTMSDAALIAALEGLSYTVTYNLNGGTNAPANPATFTLSLLPITLADATKSGYVFDGWFAEAEFTTEVTSIATLGNKTVYAKFTAE